MTYTAEMLAAAVTNMLPLDPAPSEAAINAALDGIVRGFGADETMAQEARRILHARFAVRMDVGPAKFHLIVETPGFPKQEKDLEVGGDERADISVILKK
jgi:hypothetical protein